MATHHVYTNKHREVDSMTALENISNAMRAQLKSRGFSNVLEHVGSTNTAVIRFESMDVTTLVDEGGVDTLLAVQDSIRDMLMDNDLL